MALIYLLNQLLVPVMATVGVVVILLYIVSYLNRFFNYLKIKESIFLGADAVQFLEIILLYSLFSAMFVFILFVYSHMGYDVKEYTTAIIFPYLYTFFSIILVLLFSLLILSINSRVFRYLRGELHIKPRKEISEKVGYYTELIIKYFIYIISIVVSIIILLSSFFVLANTGRGISIFFSKNIDGLVMMMFLVIFGIIAYLLFAAFIRDIKLRSKSQKEKLGKYLTTMLKNTILVLVILGIILIFLSMLGFRYADIFVFIFFIIFIFVIILFIFYTPLKNAISGIIILSTEPFVEDDYISVQNEIEGTVFNIKLLYTEIKDSRGKINLIPNSKLLEKNVRVVSSPGKNFPVRVEVTVKSEIKVEDFEQMVYMAIANIPDIDQNERPAIFLKEIGLEIDTYEICLHAEDSEKVEIIKSDILKNLKSTMEEHR
ncbi:MAG: mechanosensitive ion channel domain-containing protein [Thermoplasmata archaeon]